MDHKSFIEELDAAFRDLAPKTGSRQFDEGSLASLHNWHEVIGSHNKNQPTIPANDFRVSKSQQNPTSNDHSYVLRSGGDESAWDGRASGINSEYVMKSYKRKLKERKENPESYTPAELSLQGPGMRTGSLTEALKEGWSLGKGQRAKPAMLSINNARVEENIRRYTTRKNVMKKEVEAAGLFGREKLHASHAAAAASSSSAFGYAHSKLTKDEEMEIESQPDGGYYYYYTSEEGRKQRVEECKKAQTLLLTGSTNPGPRYNLRAPICQKEVIGGPKEPVYQRHDSLRRDLRFGSATSVRFPDPYICSPPPNAYDLSTQSVTSLVQKKPAPRLDTQCRRFLNSIYYDGLVAGGPGPSRNTIDAFKSTSVVIPVTGTLFGKRTFPQKK